MLVTKRSGETEEFSIDKIHKVLTWATQDITDVSVSDIEMQFNLNLYDKISTKEINDALARAAGNLISVEYPNYQYVASRLAMYMLRKAVWGESEPPRLLEHIQKCVNTKVYDETILSAFSETEIHKLNKYLKHDRDYDFTYAGFQQLTDKYLLKNRDTGDIFETPQFAYMLIAMTLFSKYPKDIRIEYIKKCYDYISTFKINIPTPIMAGVRTPKRQYASCILIDIGDTIPSIFSSNTAVGYYTAARAGIGLNAGRIRAIGSSIRKGEVIHTGVIPFLKTFESTVKSCIQNGIRGGGATVHFPFWHYEIEDILVLKNNAGTDDNRVRKLDYSIQFSKIFYERVVQGLEITLFSPHEVPELTDSFGLPEFDNLYLKAEKNKNLKFRRKVDARKLLELFTRERLETGRLYVMNIDHCNSHSSFLERVTQSNLCQEITQPTIPINHIDDKLGKIGVCILAAINAVATKKEEYASVCDIVVRALDELISHQDYDVNAAREFCVNHRSLGVGFTNFAAFLAKNKISYNSQEAVDIAYEYAELLQFSLLTASNQLAIEKGKNAFHDKSKYSQGILPQDTANPNVASITTRTPSLDWESLRESIKEYGLRHNSLTAQMPVESSSVVQNATNGIEPIRELITYKRAKNGNVKQVVPSVAKYGKYYTEAFDCQNKSLNNISAAIQAWFDMAISLNHYYDYDKYPDGLPISELVKDMMYAYKLGIKTIYYTNTKDVNSEKQPEVSSCESGACAI